MPAYDSTTGQDVAINEGARLVADRATFRTLARADHVPGQLGAEEMKILILGVDTDAPELYFLNTNAFAFHYDFATEVLHVGQDLGEFNGRTYFRDDRSNIAGTIVADDLCQPAGSSDAGLYALRFWPTDPVRAEHVALAFELVSRAMPFAARKLAYHPVGDAQEALYAQDRDALLAAGVRSLLTAELRSSPPASGRGPGSAVALPAQQVV